MPQFLALPLQDLHVTLLFNITSMSLISFISVLLSQFLAISSVGVAGGMVIKILHGSKQKLLYSPIFTSLRELASKWFWFCLYCYVKKYWHFMDVLWQHHDYMRSLKHVFWTTGLFTKIDSLSWSQQGFWHPSLCRKRNLWTLCCGARTLEVFLCKACMDKRKSGDEYILLHTMILYTIHFFQESNEEKHHPIFIIKTRL